MHYIDLRSDTFTRPTPAMRKAMAEAEVGDDVYGEDPTVNRLEELASERTGKEASLFVTSGTMGNLVSLLTHCGRGDEAIVGDQSHIFIHEQGGAAALGGISLRTVRTQADGTLALEDVEAAVRSDDIHHPRSRLIAIENTHQHGGGIPLPPAYMRELGALARRHRLALHVDGARLFNAAVALGVPATALTADADSVSVCISKGLAAPVGAMVCGSKPFIAEARRARKVLGGGMRQAGVIAAAGIIALEQMVDRLAEDHANAKLLGEELAGLDGITVEPVRSNMVWLRVNRPDMDADKLVALMDAAGVRTLAVDSRRVRAVLHYEITTEDVRRAGQIVRRLLEPVRVIV